MVNKILNISLFTKIIKKLDLYAYSFQKWLCKNKIGIIKWVYKGYSDKTKCMYFMIKDEKEIDKYMIILEKVSNIIKKNNSEPIYNKNIKKL